MGRGRLDLEENGRYLDYLEAWVKRSSVLPWFPMVI